MVGTSLLAFSFRRLTLVISVWMIYDTFADRKELRSSHVDRAFRQGPIR